MHDILYLDVARDPEVWRPVMQEAITAFGSRGTPSYVVPPGDPLGASVKQHAPWEIERIVIAKCPKARRMPVDV